MCWSRGWWLGRTGCCCSGFSRGVGAKFVESFLGGVYPASNQVQYRKQKPNPELRFRLAQGFQWLSGNAGNRAVLAGANLKHRVASGYQSGPAKAFTRAKHLDKQGESGPDHFDRNTASEKNVE